MTDLDYYCFLRTLDEPGSAGQVSAAEWQRGVVDEPGSAGQVSAAEWQRGVVDEPGSAGQVSAAEWQRGVVDAPPREVPMLRDAMITFRYQMRLLLREPVWIVIVMIQPLLYLALFAPLLEPLTKTAGFPPGDAWQFFVPGLLIQLGIFGSMFVGFGIIAEIRFGTVERMRVTPASRFGLLFGRVLRDTVVLLIQATLLTLIAVAFGLRVPLAGALITVGIVGLLGISLSSLSYAAGLWLKSEDALAPLLNMVSVPVLLLSGIMLPMTFAPGWLRRLAQLNPFSHVVDGARAAFLNQLGSSSLVIGLISAALLAVAGLAVATRTFQRESA